MTQKNPPVSGPRANRLKLTAGMLLSGICVVAVCLIARYYMMDESASADPVRRTAAPLTVPRTATRTPIQSPVARVQPSAQPGSAATPGSSSTLRTVASVNGEEITRHELANECLRHYGEQTLEDLINKYLIVQECKRQTLSVTQEEVNAEIKRLAERFSLPVEHWLKMLEQERGLSPRQYADVIWQILATRKLAGTRMEVSQQDLIEHFERQYGEAVKARMIVCDDRKTAEEVRAAAAANPDQFGNLAKDKSLNAPSASLNGIIQPIRKHTGPKEIEQVAFEMHDGEVSNVIPVAGQYVVLKREGLQPPVKVSFEKVKMHIIEVIRDEKSRRVAHEILRELQDQAMVENIMNDPVKSRQMPGVAAAVNGHRITVRELAEVSIERHGEEVLQGTINRRLLEQACKKRNITVTEEDLDREIARAAAQKLPLKPDASPDVDKWLALVTEEQNVSADIYRSDAVWPTVALKKLVGEQVEVTDEDLERGYEASYGPRVRCLAIFLDDLRRAQRVWEMARKNPDREYFGELAAQYSIDPGSQALKGEMRPIHKHGGRPVLEKEAFSLRPGELSSIVQVGASRYVILFCEGQTNPVQVDFASVRDLVYEEIREKKLWIAMADYFQKLRDDATIDNYLAGTVQSPKKSNSPTIRR